MKPREWFYVLLPLFATWIVDRITKQWAAGLFGMHHYGPVTFVVHQNHGAMLGLFNDLPSVLRIVTLSTSGIFILCAYLVVQYMLPIKSLTLRCGLSALIGGILGNVSDRIAWGYVVDFIMLGHGTMPTPVFNLADVFQWVGYATITFALIREGDKLWPEKELRGRYWINRSFQLKYSLLLMVIGMALSLVGLVFSYTYLKVTISELVGNNEFLINRFLKPFVISYALICLTFCVVLFMLGKFFSHRIAGPVYAFERYLRARLRGEDAKLKLRRHDDFNHLEALSVFVSEELAKIKNPESASPNSEQPPPASSLPNKIS